MATTRSTGYVVTAAVWNAVLSRLTDDGVTFSGNFNGGSVAGSTATFSSTLAVTGATTLSSTLAVTGAATLSSTLSVSGNGTFNSGGAASSTFLSPSTSAIAVRFIGRSSDDTGKIDFTNGTQSTAYLTLTTAPAGITFAADSTSRPFTFSGALIKASAQPGFLAYNSASDTAITTIGDTTVEFDTEAYDEAANFASNTFTAPVAGRYLLTASVYVLNTEGSARTFSARFKCSTAPDYYFGNDSIAATTGTKNFTGAVVVNLAASETVTVVVTPGGAGTPNFTIGGDASNPATWFSGRLLP